ncbi:hypothetical protein, variant [Fonticula alba]|uniref:ABC-2 type transporter transmembrane domain-containing protein n=1 Tax=Fonticula alba TaxID=691883 RepID=A0A058ZI55_FONAL|nr:hypothetical protein, variant [Fonticula alba]KCV73207.1 hypothetical protein, variant [Fonticula alba]|eukprot:XP_009492908.1 hypothetical protein, variant [Fonticula alba]
MAWYMRIGQMSLFGLLMDVYLLKFGFDQASVQNRSGFMYQIITMATVLGSMNAMANFPELRDMYLRERKEKLYNAFQFFAAYTMHSLPSSIVASFLFSLLTYFPLGMQQDSGTYASYLGVVLILHLFGECLGVCLLALTRDVTLANSLATMISAMFSLVGSGFIRSLETMPLPLKMLGWATPNKYATEVCVRPSAT